MRNVFLFKVLRHIDLNGSIIVLFMMGLVGCRGDGIRFPWQEKPTLTSNPISTTTATVTPPRVLTICLGQEPESLYIYTEKQSAAMWSVLEAIYDGPFDLISGKENPVILQKTPTFEDGDLYLNPVSVTAGDLIVDANNDTIVMEKGIRFLPSGCGDNSCAVVWDGSSEIQMDQVSALFSLRSNIVWSDGVDLTAGDSRYSFELASNHLTITAKNSIDRTAAYDVIDDNTIKWVGVPGLLSAEIAGMFWSPLPKHILEAIPIEQLAVSDVTNRQPLGWGPYILKEWASGDHIELVKNPNYFRSNEGLPLFDSLIYRFVNPDSGGSLAALVAGQCDLVERTSNPQSDISLVADAVNSTKAKAVWKTGPVITQLAIGIKPATYDDGYNAAVDRPDFFRNPDTRLALAACIDRQQIIKTIFDSKAGLSTIDRLLGNYSNDNGNFGLEFDSDTGSKLLDEVGWKDTDNDPSTPRSAVNIPGIPDGTPFSLTLLNPSDTTSTKVAASIANSLSNCGIQIEQERMAFSELYAPGPDGKIFGRAFDIALINWQYSPIPACYLYTSEQIPNASNYWLGGNIIGYSNPDFDKSCSGLLRLQPGEADYELLLQKVVDLFSHDLPAIPLFNSPNVVITRSDFCAFNYDPSARSDLSNLEIFNYGSQCVP